MSSQRRIGMFFMGIGLFGISCLLGQSASNFFQPLLIGFIGLVFLWAAVSNKVG
jgi:hypothetical protein